MVQHEPVLFWDKTGSMAFPISDGMAGIAHDNTPRDKVLTPAVQEFVKVLYESDAEASHETDPETGLPGGGTLTYIISGQSEHELGDLNTFNWAQKTRGLIPGGRTYIMPQIRAWEHDRDSEFSQDEVNDINREYDLVCAMDGALDDRDQFVSWLQNSNGGGKPNIKVFFLLVGNGDDTRAALEDYRGLARQHPEKIVLLEATHTSDPRELAQKMLSAIGD